MRLAHLQQQVSELRNNTDPEKGSDSFTKHIVILHSYISGAAIAFRSGQADRYAQELAALVIGVVDFPAMFPNWGDIWGTQTLQDFKSDSISGELWDYLYKLHQLASGLVGGRSDIILLYKMLQIARAAAQVQNVNLDRAIEQKLAAFRQTAQVN